MARVCFASYEIAPTTKGGTGVLLRNVADVLLSAGHEVIFLLDLPPWEYEAFVGRDRFLLPNFERCRAYHLPSVVGGEDGPTEEDFGSHFAWRAYRFHLAARIIYETERPDLMEFFDYGGVGHFALSAKVAGLGYSDTHLAIRLHTSLELMDRVSAEATLDFDREYAYALEHGALRLAETVLFPTPSYLSESYLPYYEPWLGSLVEAPPPIVDVPARRRRRTKEAVVLYYGRLSELKGVGLFLDAAVAMLQSTPSTDLVFYLVGFDPSDPDATHESGASLRKRIPTRFQDRFVFTGQWSRSQLNRLLPRVRLAVFPTYIESFGYAAHELRAAGVPLILSPIPAFRDHFAHERDALFFDGTVEDLVCQMSRLATDGTLREHLANAPPPPSLPARAFYEALPEESWITMSSAEPHEQVDLLVCVIGDDAALLDRTTRGIIGTSGVEVVVMRTRETDSSGGVWFLGRPSQPEDVLGVPLEPTALFTKRAILVLRAGDAPDLRFIDTARSILARQPEISYVACWKRRPDESVDTRPVDVMPEVFPLLGEGNLTRAVARTEPGRFLIDLFDRRAGELAEVTYVSGLGTGLMVPEVMMAVDDDSRPVPPERLAYAIMSDESPWHARRLARWLGAWFSDSVVTGAGRGQVEGPRKSRWAAPQ